MDNIVIALLVGVPVLLGIMGIALDVRDAWVRNGYE